jgi:hypothetical protein
VATFTYNAIGNLTSKSDVGSYSYPAPGQPRPHGMTSISGGVINTTFTAACPRVGAAEPGGRQGQHDGGQRAHRQLYRVEQGQDDLARHHLHQLQPRPRAPALRQTNASGVTLYIGGGGVLAERFAGSGGSVQWTNYLIAAAGLGGDV